MAVIDKEKFHILEFVKKTEYIGSVSGMRYMVQRTGDDTMEVVLWPEPNSYGATDESLKIRKEFPLSAEGTESACDYINEQYEAQKALWDIRKKPC